MLEVGRIVKAHGIRGEVIVDLVSNRPDLRLAPGSVLASNRGTLEVLTATPHQGRWIVAFRGIEDRNAAETYRDVVLSAEPVEGDEDTLWVHELIGAEVFDLAGRSYGLVRGGGGQSRLRPAGPRRRQARALGVREDQAAGPGGHRPAGGPAGLTNRAAAQWPRRTHSSTWGDSAPIVVESPWPVWTTVSGGM